MGRSVEAIVYIVGSQAMALHRRRIGVTATTHCYTAVFLVENKAIVLYPTCANGDCKDINV